MSGVVTLYGASGASPNPGLDWLGFLLCFMCSILILIAIVVGVVDSFLGQRDLKPLVNLKVASVSQVR